MKKIFSLVMVLALLYSAAACGGASPLPSGENDGISGSDSPQSSGESGESESSQTPSDTEYIPPDSVIAVNNLLTGDIDRSLQRQNFLRGAAYTSSAVSGGGDGSYADRGNMLTDGIIVEGFEKNNWVGYQNKNKIEITFDFGGVKTGIADVEAGFLTLNEYGIWLPDYVELCFSDDGEDYTAVSRVNIPRGVNDIRRVNYGFYLQNSVSARYMKLVILISRNAFVFIDEIAAFTYDGGEAEEGDLVYDYYPEYTLDSGEVYWDPGDDDFQTEQNLALGKTVYISSFYPLPKFEAKTSSNSTVSDSHFITDGKYITSPSWDRTGVFRFTRGDGRDVIIDLEKISAVTGAKGEFIAHPSWGVYQPDLVGFSASVNGSDWQGVGTAAVEYDKSKDAQSCKFDIDFAGVFKARYVKVSFLCPSFRAIGEIEITGTKAVPDTAQTPNPAADDITNLSDCYVTPEKFGGINNILCTPICRGDGVNYDPAAMVTTDDFLPLVGYYEDGRLIDTFMDTFLISPCSAYTVKEDIIRLDGWKFYVNSQFRESLNLPALNEAAEIVGGGLGIADYKVNIFMSLLRPVPTSDDGQANSFGDIDGDGEDDPLNLLENRIKALKWMVDTQIAMLEAANCGRINLVGFYWQEEYINDNDPDEIKAFEYIRDYIKGKGYKIIWIPYYNAQAFYKWREFGFDLACLQPNYAFVYTASAERLTSAAIQARLFGMCVELETNTYTNLINIIRYKQYLEYGVKYGYMNAVKIYYQNVIPTEITRAMNHPDPFIASIYKDTYLFAKGLLDENYSYKGECVHGEETEISAEAEKAGRKYIGTADLGSASGYTFSLELSPKYGYIETNPDGSFAYTPLTGFKGKDYFCLRASFIDGFNLTVRVEVDVS